MYNVYFTPQSKRDFKKLPKDIQRRIIIKIKFFVLQKDPVSFSKPLVNLPPSTHRFRIGNYRIVFYISGNSLYIDRIKHRKEVYNTK